MKYCQECGNKLKNEGAKFCEQCGNSIDGKPIKTVVKNSFFKKHRRLIIEIVVALIILATGMVLIGNLISVSSDNFSYLNDYYMYSSNYPRSQLEAFLMTRPLSSVISSEVDKYFITTLMTTWLIVVVLLFIIYKLARKIKESKKCHIAKIVETK